MIDSVTTPFKHRDNTIFIKPQNLEINSTILVTVEYKGKPPIAENPPWDGGFTWSKSKDGYPWIGVSCQSNGSHLWYPSKEHPSDEPESAELHITVPKPLSVASNGNLQNVPHRVIIKLQEQGWILRNTIIWSKTNPKPSSSKSNLTPSYEFIFHLVKTMEYDYYPTLTKLSDKTKPSLPPRHRSINGDYSKSVTPYLPNVNGKNMGDYWNEDIVRTSVANQKLNIQGEHPAPFPNEIITLPILQTSKEFELVLDPFMGSGTTGRVCDNLNRNFVGYDLKLF